MSHIASPSFYRQVQKNIATAKNDGYVLFYEGVRAGTPENMEDFNEALGIDMTPTLYTSISELYGITAQNNDDFLGIVNDNDENVDLSIDEIMDLYKKSGVQITPPNPQTQ